MDRGAGFAGFVRPLDQNCPGWDDASSVGLYGSQHQHHLIGCADDGNLARLRCDDKDCGIAGDDPEALARLREELTADHGGARDGAGRRKFGKNLTNIQGRKRPPRRPPQARPSQDCPTLSRLKKAAPVQSGPSILPSEIAQLSLSRSVMMALACQTP